MVHGSLFSGIGGFDLAADWMGWENAFHCEFNPFCQRILKYYWPNAATYTDIRETDFTLWRGSIDILTGGFPCQPYSTAGKRRGKDDERHLWPEMLRAIREIRPRWIVGENVRGIISWNAGLVFEEVQAGLEAEGYEVQPFVLPAASVGAPHRRDRVWFVAYAKHNGPFAGKKKYKRDKQQEGREEEQDGIKQFKGGYQGYSLSKQLPTPAHPHHTGSTAPGNGANPNGQAQGEEREREPRRRLGGFSVWRVAADASIDDDRRDNGEPETRQEQQLRGSSFESVTADAPEQGLPGGPRPGRRVSGTEKRTQQGSMPEGTYTAADWAAFPSQPPVLPGNDGVSAPVAGYTERQWYNEHIKAAGNAIVPQVALQIFRAIEAYERETEK